MTCDECNETGKEICNNPNTTCAKCSACKHGAKLHYKTIVDARIIGEGAFPNDPTRLRREFAIKFHRGDFLSKVDHKDNSEYISNWWLEQLTHKDAEKDAVVREAKLLVFAEIIKYTDSVVNLNRIAKEIVFANLSPFTRER